MMETDDKLLKQFFADNRQEIANNGFSRRVMRHLPGRYRRISQLWSTFCFTLAAVLFVSLDGLQLLLGTLRESFTSAVRIELSQLDPKSLLLIGVVLIYFVYRKLSSLV